MKSLSTSTAWAIAIPLWFIGGTTAAGTYICSGLDGREVYTDHNRPGCREFTPTPPNDVEGKPSAKPPQAPTKRAEPAPIPSLPPGDQKRGAITELDHKGATYSEQDLLRAVASGDKGKTEMMLRAGISANAKD